MNLTEWFIECQRETHTEVLHRKGQYTINIVLKRETWFLDSGLYNLFAFYKFSFYSLVVYLNSKIGLKMFNIKYFIVIFGIKIQRFKI